ncbi:hypothetical protein K2173_017156 [Erythroxylum novogranatense]|uniref:Glutamine amidotransferase type-2 domain-containing protein n=1 Tax=Erythroxylum novogranatense TaxID=1862640 RepID=A0AAV8U8Q0_9ROSI|nr:hypothetical protein K2173_017156 [Erythroxylum novogranatense]
MCGIALIVSGLRIGLPTDSSIPTSGAEIINFTNRSDLYSRAVVSVDDLKAALLRRGPDSLGAKTLTLESRISTPIDYLENCCAELRFFGATLQLRGLDAVVQPFEDSSGNILIYNGEIFGGVHVDRDGNDGEVLLHMLGKCCSCSSSEHETACSSNEQGRDSIPHVLSSIKGPWALIYWQYKSRTLWFGRDAFGRRSLLVHWPTESDNRFLLSSVSPGSSLEQNSDMEVDNGADVNFWEELSCGIYSLSFDTRKIHGWLTGQVKRHGWTNSTLMELIKWDRLSVEPQPVVFHSSHSQNVLLALRKSVMLRTSFHTNFQAVKSESRQNDIGPVAILFSGGLDSMILAALLNECLDLNYGIDLLNVSFDGECAPDRISAKAGLQELRRLAPLRRWKLVEIDADLSNLTTEMKHVMTLIKPAKTYMDLNIGTALWLAASGEGWVYEGTNNINNENQQRFRYKSEARIVLVGSGADEQCAGYGRHKTKYRCGSWRGLHEEMKLDMQRIWKRNMGRDDRCISDNGKEISFLG